MTVRHFQVSTKQSGYTQTVQVHVYDEIEQLRKAARRFSMESSGFEDAAACAQCLVRISIGADGAEDDVREIYHIRLQKDRLATGVIVHEINHIAMAMYGQSFQVPPELEEVLSSGNEHLAYIHSDLAIGIVNKLYDMGYYKRPKED